MLANVAFKKAASPAPAKHTQRFCPRSAILGFRGDARTGFVSTGHQPEATLHRLERYASLTDDLNLLQLCLLI